MQKLQFSMSNSYCHRHVVSLAELFRRFLQISDTDLFLLSRIYLAACMK